MNKITSILVLLGILAIIPNISFAQANNFPPPAISAGWNNLTISSATNVLTADGTRIEWTIHPENGNLRCTFGNAYGSIPPAPTSSTGLELLSGGYYTSFPVTVATGIVACIPESGSVTLSYLTDNR